MLHGRSVDNNSLIVVNYEHAGNRGNGSLKLANTTASATITRIAKWYNAPIGLGQAWVNLQPFRGSNVATINTTGRTISFSVAAYYFDVYINGVLVHGIIQSPVEGAPKVQAHLEVPDGSSYKYVTRSGGIASLDQWELR